MEGVNDSTAAAHQLGALLQSRDVVRSFIPKGEGGLPPQPQGPIPPNSCTLRLGFPQTWGIGGRGHPTEPFSFPPPPPPPLSLLRRSFSSVFLMLLLGTPGPCSEFAR